MKRRAGQWAVAVLVVSGACGGSGSEGELVVSAAASLSGAFADVATAYEEAYPGVDVVLNVGGSNALRAQILEGAPVDVFASADARTMEAVEAAGLLVGEPEVFARNALQIVMPVGNPGRVTSLADFADEALLVGLCAEPVPCGASALAVLDAAGVEAAVDTHEPDVRALLTKITEGELDAAIVYVTDAVAAADDVETIDIPAGVNFDVVYPIAALSVDGATGRRPNRDAEGFVAFVLSDAGQAILAQHGFSR